MHRRPEWRSYFRTGPWGCQGHMRMKRRLVVIAFAGLVTVSVASAPSDKTWFDFGGGPSSSHFVDLDQINKSNVGQLEVAWFYPWAAAGFNPVVIDDIIYVLGRGNSL